MCRLLIVASTETEIQDFLDSKCIQSSHNQFHHQHINHIRVLITGIGMVCMTLQLSRFLTENHITQAINIGFTGSFDQKIQLGSLVNVQNDVFAEIGVSDENEEIVPFDRLIQNENLLKHLSTFVKPQMTIQKVNEEFISVNGITVNTCTGDIRRAEYMMTEFGAQVESMEGAAFFLTCNSFKIPCVQIRAVSNHIPGRSPDKWNTGLAQKNISEFLKQFTNKFK